MSISSLNRVIELISLDQLGEAVGLFQDQNSNHKLTAKLILIQGRLSDWESKKHAGSHSPHELKLERNSIRKDLLGLLVQASNEYNAEGLRLGKSENIRQQILGLISQDLLKDALEAILQNEVPQFLEEKATLLMGRLKEWENKNSSDTLQPELLKTERNKIREDVLNLFVSFWGDGSINDPREIIVRQNRKWIVNIFLYAILGGLMAFFLLSHKRKIRVEADLEISRVNFPYQSGLWDMGGAWAEEILMKNFSHLNFHFPGKILIDKDFNEFWDDSTKVTNNMLSIKAQDDIPSNGINLGPANLERINLERGDIVSLNSSESGQYFDFSIGRKNHLNGELNFGDSLEVNLAYADVKGWNYSEALPWEYSLLLSKPGTGGKIEYQLSSGTSMFGLRGLEDRIILGSNLKIGTPTFYKTVNETPVSTVIKGNLRIKETGLPAIREIVLDTNDHLEMEPVQDLEISRLNFGEGKISLSLVGQVKVLKGGPKLENLHPSRIEWFWHNHKVFMAVMGVFILGFLVLLPMKFSDPILNFLALILKFK